MKNALPQHKFWNHEILLKPGMEPTFEPIWFLFEKKLKVIQNYLQMNLKKWFICFLISLINYPITFAKKKGQWKLCIDY